MAKKRKTVWVISGTHWDREWRYTSDQSLPRLAELVDALLDILEQHPEFTCFHLDGGTIVIEDYLAVRPENEQRLRKLIEAGRIASVVWYTLPEMNIVAPEALIRNLLIGQRMANRFGGAMTSGYTATSYGQISQLPQIYSGFGLQTALSYRGTNKYQVPPICQWEGADGTQIHHIRCFDEVTRTNWFFFAHYELVLGKSPRDLRLKYDRRNLPVHMADESLYETAFQLLWEDYGFRDDPEALRAAIRHLAQQAGPQAIGDHLLALDMEDNAVPYVNLPKILAAINAAQSEYECVLAPLDTFVAAARNAVKGRTLPVHKGEFRYAAIEAGFNGLLGSTQSSRVRLKLLNHEAETDLIAVAEPLCAMAAMRGATYPHSLLERAWLALLKNHAHDSICGAAIDEAHEDMPSRFRATRMLARETSRKACEHLWSTLDTAKHFENDDLTITFFNPTPVRRLGVVPAVIDTPITDFGDLYIEPCSGAGPIIEGIDVDELVTYSFFDILDEKGRPVSHHVLEKENLTVEAERKLDSNAVVYSLVRYRMLMDVDVPPLGYRTYALRPRKRRYVTDPKPAGDRPLLATPAGGLENEYLRVAINPNGTFDLTDRKTRRTIAGMHYFADNGALKNAHQYCTPLRDVVVTSLGSAATITLVENNSLRATWRIDLTMRIPASSDLAGRDRSPHTLELPITSWLTLRRGSPRLEIRTRFDNAARDHRLRVMLPTDVRTDRVQVEAPFDVVTRNIQWDVIGDNHEGHYPFQPMQSFIDLTDGRQGVALLTKGLREYEVVDDPRRTIALTLMRSHRAYMLAKKEPLTPEEYEHNPGQHSIGMHEMEYAILPHAGDWRRGEVMRQARDFTTPWRILQGVPKPGVQPVTRSMVTVGPTEHVQLAAFYESADRDGFILRLWNSSDRSVQATLESACKLGSVEKLRMDETEVINKLRRNGKRWSIPLRKKEIATLRLRPA